MSELPEKLKDKWWRLTNLYKIKDKQGQLVTFFPNYLQLKHLHDRESGPFRYNYIVKFRQGGFTTLYAIDLLDDALWVPGMTCGIIAHEAKKLPDYFTIVKRAFENLPEGLKPERKTDTKYMYEFTRRYDGQILDSSIYVSVDIRGGTVQRLHITESAYIKDRQNLKAGSKQAVPITGQISEETTGNGFNQFYDDYMIAKDSPSPGQMAYKCHFYSWVEHNEYQLPGKIETYDAIELDIKKIAKEQFGIDVKDEQLIWRRWKKIELASSGNLAGIKLNTDQLFKQEYPLTLLEAFQSGAGNVFDTEKIESTPIKQNLTWEELQAQTPLDLLPQYRHLDYQGVRIFELPVVNAGYIIGVDPSDGEGSDFGAISVWKKPVEANQKKVKVAEFYGKLRPDLLANLTAKIAEVYNKAFVGIENNMLTCVLELSKIYDNYYFYTDIDKKTLHRTKKLGWNTNTKTRDPMIDDFIKEFEEDSLEINSARTLSEMRTFVRKELGKREHADGKFDDMLFADFIAIQMVRLEPSHGRIFSEKPSGF